MLNEDQLLMLTCIAKGKDDNINDYAANEEAMKQQREIENQINQAKMQNIPKPQVTPNPNNPNETNTPN